MKPFTVRLAGVLIAFGGIIWLTTRLVLGPQPADAVHATEIAGGGAFQIGLLAMLLVMRATNAAGDGRGGWFTVHAGLVFVALALLWTLIVTIETGFAAATPVVILDVFWPLSMVWLIVVGVGVLRARSWPTPVRYLPLAASLVLPVQVVAGVVELTEWQGWVLPILYVTVAYALLGTAVARQIPALIEDRHGPRPASLPGAR